MLTGLSIPELENLLAPLPRFRAAQLYKWISRGAVNFDEMTNIPASMREDFKKRFSLHSSAVDSIQEDNSPRGGAKKIVVALKDGLKAEAVLLKDGKERNTACLSTQAGCPVGCVFCKTGSLGFSRNLTSAEIVEQFIFLRQINSIDNIVVMGMGEPLLNLSNLRSAIAVITDPQGMNFSKRRITVSTCGICEGLIDFARNGPSVRLALSLTTADEALRKKLMPVTSANPLSKIKDALLIYQKNGGYRLTFEVVLLGGINVREKDAFSVAEFAKGLDTVVNLILWNPVPGLEFEGEPLREPEKKETENFKTLLENYGLKVTMRLRKGRKVMGACGQLGNN